MIAVVDLGTNTFNLLVAERAADTLRIVHSEDLPVNLGHGGIEHGRITDEAFQRGIATLRRMMETADRMGALRIQGYGTSMLRNASNGVAFCEQARLEAGVPIQIINGEEEATLIMEGVRLAVPLDKRPALVMDIGGGSIEFILANDRAVLWKRSFELGTTRMLERFPFSDPLGMDEQLTIAAHLNAHLGPLRAQLQKHRPAKLIGSAGSFDSLATMVATGRGVQIAADQHQLVFDAMTFDAIKDELLARPREKRLGYPGLPDYRVDTIIPALVAIDQLLQQGIGELVWSRFALKEGAAWRMLCS